MAEPIFHFFDDCIDDNHVLLAEDTIHCHDCRTMVHCLNEVMTAWFETGVGPMCLECFAKRYISDLGWNAWTFDELEIE